MNVFDIVNNLSYSKKSDLKSVEDFEKIYVSYLINKSFSYFMDTLMLSNEMNRYPFLDKNLQYDFYFRLVKPRKRFSKWIKKDEQNVEIINSIREYYNCNETCAKEYFKILKPEQLKHIQKCLNKGGR